MMEDEGYDLGGKDGEAIDNLQKMIKVRKLRKLCGQLRTHLALTHSNCCVLSSVF